jgi:hypothetical protein
VAVDFGSVGPGVGGLVLTEFTSAAVTSRDYTTMREEGGVISNPTQVNGAVENFSDRPGRPSRHFDPAQRNAGGESLVLWVATTFSAAVDVVVEIKAWGQNPTDPNVGRAVDYSPGVPANPNNWILVRDRVNQRVATLFLPAFGRLRFATTGTRRLEYAAPANASTAGSTFVPLLFDGGEIARDSVPHLHWLVAIVPASGAPQALITGPIFIA